MLTLKHVFVGNGYLDNVMLTLTIIILLSVIVYNTSERKKDIKCTSDQ